MDHAEIHGPTIPSTAGQTAAKKAAHLRRVRRKAMFGYAYLVTPGVAFLGLALFDAVTKDRWTLFLILLALIGVFFFYLPLIGHFRCARCRHYFCRERLRLFRGDTVYRCAECGHSDAVREWCGMTDMVKSSRCLVRVKPPEPVQHIDEPRPRP